MSMQDPIADMLTRIRNAQSAGKLDFSLPASQVKLAILNVLKNEGYIEDYQFSKEAGKSNITVSLKYFQGKSAIEKIERISRPGLRVYKRFDELSSVGVQMGIVVVSTPKGVMTAAAAQANKLGGEVLCSVE